MASTSRLAAPSLLELIKPPQLKGIKTLDKSLFNQTYPILSIKIDPRNIGKLRNSPLLRGYMMDFPRIKHVVDDPRDSQSKLLRLRIQSQDELPEEVLDLIQTESADLVEDALEVNYESWNTSAILNSILPSQEGDELAPSAYTQTGHIGHVNLNEEWLPYKKIIGEVMLDKNPQLRTIVNKLDSIHAEYRYFDMEVLAGEEDYIATTNESDCKFTFDFSRVYWNSRLQNEHDRLVALLPPGAVVADVMAGVGPFAVPAAKKGCYVLGNDLNPESVKWMRKNQADNKVEPTLRVSEMDGRQFIRESAALAWKKPFTPHTYMTNAELRKQQKQARKDREHRTAAGTEGSLASATSNLAISESKQEMPTPQLVEHYIMNLPDSALTFLDAFRGLYSTIASETGFDAALRVKGYPMVHVYCFTRELEFEPAQKDVCERASQYLGHIVNPDTVDYHLHLVRRVAPNKDMYCLSFRLPEAVALATR